MNEGIEKSAQAIKDSNEQVTITSLNFSNCRLADRSPEEGRIILNLLNDLPGLETINLQHNMFNEVSKNPGIFADVLNATEARVTLSERDVARLSDEEKERLGKAIANKSGAPSDIVLNSSTDAVPLDPELPETFTVLKKTQPVVYYSAVRERTLGAKHLTPAKTPPEEDTRTGWRAKLAQTACIVPKSR